MSNDAAKLLALEYKVSRLHKVALGNVGAVLRLISALEGMDNLSEKAKASVDAALALMQEQVAVLSDLAEMDEKMP